MIDLVTNKQQLFDLWASLYDFVFPSLFYQATHQRMLDYVKLPQRPNVLDLGCGTGGLFQRLASQYPDLRGTGLDFSPEMLRQTRHSNRHRPRLIFVQVLPLPYALPTNNLMQFSILSATLFRACFHNLHVWARFMDQSQRL